MTLLDQQASKIHNPLLFIFLVMFDIYLVHIVYCLLSIVYSNCIYYTFLLLVVLESDWVGWELLERNRTRKKGKLMGR